MIDWRARTLEVNDRTYAAWNAHDADAVAAVFAPDAVLLEAGVRSRSAGATPSPRGPGRCSRPFPT
jgi:ketosteroid isomerase-like protein